MQTSDAARAVRPLVRVRQIREFTEEPVAREALNAIADAGRWSGSSANTQPWRFVIIRDRQTLTTIAEAGKPSTRSLATAPAAIAIVLPEKPGGGIGNAFDEGRAAERMLVAASLLGLGAGIAWVRNDARPLVAGRLGLPEGRFVRTVLAIGHPTASARKPKSPRGAARLPRRGDGVRGALARVLSATAQGSRSQMPVSRSAARAPSSQVSTTLTKRRSSSATPWA